MAYNNILPITVIQKTSTKTVEKRTQGFQQKQIISGGCFREKKKGVRRTHKHMNQSFENRIQEVNWVEAQIQQGCNKHLDKIASNHRYGQGIDEGVDFVVLKKTHLQTKQRP